MALSLGDSLVSWINSLGLSAPAQNIESLSDGVLVTEVLAKIAPNHFDASGVKRNVGDNWLLKMSNLKALVKSLTTHFSELHHESPHPTIDVSKIARESNEGELVKLLEVVLECAILSDDRAIYVEKMQKMPKNAQQQLLPLLSQISQRLPDDHADAPQTPTTPRSAIDEVVEQPTPPSQAAPVTVIDTAAVEERDAARKQVAQLREEVTALQKQIDALKQENQKKTTATKSEVADLMTEFQMQLDEKESMIADLKKKVDDSNRTQAEIRALKDEVETLRETAKTAAIIEAQLEKYKRRAESQGDLANQIKELDDANQQHMADKLKLEDQLRVALAAQDQLRAKKQQCQELELELATTKDDLDSATREASRNKDLSEQLKRDTEQLRKELEAARQQLVRVEELGRDDGPLEVTGSLMEERVAPAVSEKIARLEHENKILRQQAGGASPDIDSQVEDLREMKAKYEKEYITARGRVKELESELKELRNQSDSKILSLEGTILNLQSELVARTSTDTPTPDNEKLKTLQEAYAQLQGENISLKTKLSQAKSEMEETSMRMQKVIDEKVAQAVERAQEQATASAMTGASTSADLQSALSRVAELETELNKRKQTIAMAKKMYEDVATQNKELRSRYEEDINGLQRTIDDLHKAVDSTSTEADRFKEMLKEQREIAKREQMLVSAAFYEFGMQLQATRRPTNAVGPVPQGSSWLAKSREQVNKQVS